MFKPWNATLPTKVSEINYVTTEPKPSDWITLDLYSFSVVKSCYGKIARNITITLKTFQVRMYETPTLGGRDSFQDNHMCIQ